MAIGGFEYGLHGCTTHIENIHCSMRVVRLTGGLATDCIQAWLGLEESSPILQTASSSSGLRRKEVRVKQPLPVITLLQRTILIPVAPWCQQMECDPSLGVWQPHLGHPVQCKTSCAQRRSQTSILPRIELLLQLT